MTKITDNQHINHQMKALREQEILLSKQCHRIPLSDANDTRDQNQKRRDLNLMSEQMDELEKEK